MLHLILKAIAPVVTFLAPVIIWLAKWTPYFHIKDPDGSVYMERYWVIFPRWITGGWGVRLHCIRRSDKDRALHDHPWDFGSVILRGGYFEVIYEADGWASAERVRDNLFPDALITYDREANKTVIGHYMRRGDVNVKLLEGWPWHRLRLLSDFEPYAHEATWTLFVCGPYRQGWGFRVDGKKVPNREYIEQTQGADRVKENEANLVKAFGARRAA